jgi:hypothetical protein
MLRWRRVCATRLGRFARSLNIKALRHYDAEGLLAPAHIDPPAATAVEPPVPKTADAQIVD